MQVMLQVAAHGVVAKLAAIPTYNILQLFGHNTAYNILSYTCMWEMTFPLIASAI